MSVTQQFNTTKIAASKQKGMWMGGTQPLGYDVRDRRLVVNEGEAETVRHIFRTYAELGSVNALKQDLDRAGIVSKRRPDSAYQLKDIGGRLQLAKLCLPVCRCTTLKLLGDKPSARTHQPERSSNVLFPATTAIFAAVLALVYASMTVWVMASRTSNGTLQGDGGNEGLQNRIRAHGNFGEYVPLALVLIGLLESGGGNHAVVLALLWVLLVGRLLHPVGLFARPNSAQMFACRGGGMLATLVSLVVAACRRARQARLTAWRSGRSCLRAFKRESLRRRGGFEVAPFV